MTAAVPSLSFSVDPARPSPELRAPFDAAANAGAGASALATSLTCMLGRDSAMAGQTMHAGRGCGVSALRSCGLQRAEAR